MNYSTEIRSAMEQTSNLADAEAHRKTNGRDREYWSLLAKRNALEHRECDLRRQAAREFAALNGWRWVERHFLARALARGGTHGGSWGILGARDPTMDGMISHNLFDHPVFFREIARPYRTAAIVGQPYHTEIAKARAIAAKIGLALHVPPNSTASWWYPGSTRFFCLTRPEITTVQFLPEQMGCAKETANDD